jgi:hypothetical protein
MLQTSAVQWLDWKAQALAHRWQMHFDILRKMRNKARDKRKNSTLAALLSPTRRGVLTSLFLRPDKEWYLSELATSLGTSS